jgi:hypothetical protein
MLNRLKNNLKNIPGWNTTKRIVVIESDDWGSIRMPSNIVYNKLLKKGIGVNNDLFCRYDSLATKTDLEVLFDALCSVKDKNGKNVVLTADTVMANPDFEKIEQSDFKEYHYELFTETLSKSVEHKGAFAMWETGIKENIFHPQFHGREHLNIDKWLCALQNNEYVTKLAFNYKTFGLSVNASDSIEGDYMGAFNSSVESDIDNYKLILNEGLDIFESIFKFRSKSFIATTYTWSPKIEPILKMNGVDYLQGLVTQRIPLDSGTTFKYQNGNFQGKKNKYNQIYLTRNCFFEPAHFRDKFDVVDECLSRIDSAFRWGKAAVISSHRLNFIGSIDEANRTKNIQLFRKLLKAIVHKWPDVEFMTSDKLGDIIKKDYYD